MRYPLTGEPPSDAGAFQIASKLSAVFGTTVRVCGAVVVVAGTVEVTSDGPNPATELGETRM